MAHQLQRQNGIRGLAPIVCLLLAACLAGPAICESEPQPTAEPTQADFSVSLKAESRNPAAAVRRVPTRGSSGQFYHGHFLPNMTRRLDEMGTVDLAQHGLDLGRHVYFDRWTEATRKNVTKATAEALKDYLLEDTSLRSVVAAVERIGGSKNAAGLERRRKIGFDLGVSHARPQVEMRYRDEDRSVRLSLNSKLILGVEFRNSELTRNRVVAKLDPRRGAYALSYRIGF